MRRTIPILLFLPAVILITGLACGGSSSSDTATPTVLQQQTEGELKRFTNAELDSLEAHLLHLEDKLAELEQASALDELAWGSWSREWNQDLQERREAFDEEFPPGTGIGNYDPLCHPARFGIGIAYPSLFTLWQKYDGLLDKETTQAEIEADTAELRNWLDDARPSIAACRQPSEVHEDSPKPQPIDERGGAQATVNNGANLRAGPGTDFAVVGGAKEGDIIELVARNGAGDWYQLASGAWIAAFLVDNAPGGLPVEEATASRPQPPTATPEAGEVARPIGIGTHIVGDSIQPGIYRGLAGQGVLNSCYWERLRDLSGELESTIANDNVVGQFYVEVKSTDYALKTACQLTPLAQASALSVGDTLAPGTYLVGRDIRPGTYQGEAGTDVLNSCYWERLNDVAGELGSLIANDNAMGSYFVQVLGSDFALKTKCTLVRVGD